MYEMTRKSLMKFVLDQIAALNAEPGSVGNITYEDFDAHGEVDQLPTNDCIGLHQFSIVDNANTWTVVFGVTISTYNDTNLMNLIHYADRFFTAMSAQTNLSIYDPVSAAEVGKLCIFAGTSANPIERANTRPVVSLQANGQLALVPS